MGWSKADVFAGLRPERNQRPRATVALRGQAYEGIVATGNLHRDPRRNRGGSASCSNSASWCVSPPGSPPQPGTPSSELWAGGDEIDLALSPADVGRGRPEPDLILGAMAHLGVGDPGAVAVVGDTVSDLEAGSHARAAVR